MQINNNNNIIDNLDDSWIIEYEKQYNIYNNYYKEDINYIKLTCIYLNNLNYVETMKEEMIILSQKNILSRDEILRFIKNNNIKNNIQYNLLFLLKYNIDLDPLNLNTFLKNKNNISYLTSVTMINDIIFKPSITMFHDLNNLIIIFYPKINNSQEITKKVYIKKITNKNKTIRNTFKDI
jgi:hypothetical protein